MRGYAGGLMQQPVRQKSVLGHAGKQLTPQAGSPAGQTGVGQTVPEPPVPGLPPLAGAPPEFEVPPPGLLPPEFDVPPVFGAPPVPVGVHEGGSVSLPTQSSHVPQVLLQPVLCTQGGHFVGSAMSASVHVPVMFTFFVPPPGNGMLQHPKQSHPFGVYLRQKSLHCCVSVHDGSVCGSAPVRQPVL